MGGLSTLLNEHRVALIMYRARYRTEHNQPTVLPYPPLLLISLTHPPFPSLSCCVLLSCALSAAAERQYERSKVKRRMLANINFIGELFKVQMLTSNIMHYCITTLLDEKNEPDEEKIELLCKLLQSIGEATVVGPILLGLSKSVQIAPLSASVSKILNMAMMAAYDGPRSDAPVDAPVEFAEPVR